MKHLEPIIYNKTLKTFNENVPVHLTLINETTAALNSSTMRTVMSRDTHTEDIFTNLTLAINILTENETYFNEATVQALMKARLRLGMITGDFLSSLPQGVGPGGFHDIQVATRCLNALCFWEVEKTRHVRECALF